MKKKKKKTAPKIKTTCINLYTHSIRDVSFPRSRHVTRIAKYIKLKRPQVKLFIWHDMLSQLVSSGNNNVKNKKETNKSFKCLTFVFD